MSGLNSRNLCLRLRQYFREVNIPFLRGVGDEGQIAEDDKDIRADRFLAPDLGLDKLDSELAGDSKSFDESRLTRQLEGREKFFVGDILKIPVLSALNLFIFFADPRRRLRGKTFTPADPSTRWKLGPGKEGVNPEFSGDCDELRIPLFQSTLD